MLNHGFVPTLAGWKTCPTPMKNRALRAVLGAALIAMFTISAAEAQSFLIDRLDVKKDGKISRDKLPESMRGMFDRMAEMYHLDPQKTFSRAELEAAMGASS